MTQTITKLLIANRGEIACRIMRTAKRLSIGTVAVFTSEDEAALHVQAADEASAVESYLRQDQIIQTALQAGADAIHPGYGFLSENAGFARAVRGAGLIFVGPPADAIAATGAKSEAKALMEQAGVPVVPGYHGTRQEPEFLKQKAYEIGYPVLIKAVAGGGGKGMRRVDKAIEFEAALAGAVREAENAFSDGRVLIEKWITRPRHIEVQIFGDETGRVEALFERDCTLQRRHQKIIEEAPAPGMTERLRARIMAAACDAGRAVGYTGAGTVEFIVDASEPLSDETQFFFMEMNTRLQVEHPVTEAITGLDLVEVQLKVAEGEALPFNADDLTINGHAIEARLYAEDPFNGYLPSAGRIERLAFPDHDSVRIDAGVEEGGAVSASFDPMIAKIIAHGPDREAARTRLAVALREVIVTGVRTNLAMLIHALEGEAFRDFTIDTTSIDREPAAFLPEKAAPDEQLLSAVALTMSAARSKRIQAEKFARDRALDPIWDRGDCWTNAGDNPRHFNVRSNGESHAIPLAVDAGLSDLAIISAEEDRVEVWQAGQLLVFEAGQRDDQEDAAGDSGQILSPMHGRLIAKTAEHDQTVTRGDPVAIVEAMKMEHTIEAARDGTVTWRDFEVGDQVEKGAILAEIVEGVDGD